jgi:hypothetical protein
MEIRSISQFVEYWDNLRAPSQFLQEVVQEFGAKPGLLEGGASGLGGTWIWYLGSAGLRGFQ